LRFIVRFPGRGNDDDRCVGTAREIDEPFDDRRILHRAANDDERAFVGAMLGGGKGRAEEQDEDDDQAPHGYSL
jgi:hypothetical protein